MIINTMIITKKACKLVTGKYPKTLSQPINKPNWVLANYEKGEELIHLCHFQKIHDRQRKQRAKQILQNQEYKFTKINSIPSYQIHSPRGKDYLVSKDELGNFFCTCKDFEQSNKPCKHIYAVKSLS